MLDCAPSSQFDESAHVYNVDDPTLACDYNFTLDPQPSSPFHSPNSCDESLVPYSKIDESLRELEMNPNLRPFERQMIETLRIQLDMIREREKLFKEELKEKKS